MVKKTNKTFLIHLHHIQYLSEAGYKTITGSTRDCVNVLKTVPVADFWEWTKKYGRRETQK